MRGSKPQGSDLLLFRNVSPRVQLVRMWSFVGLCVETALELTDGRAERLRVVTGNTKRRSFAPSAASSHGSTISTGWHESSMCERTGATGGGRCCKTPRRVVQLYQAAQGGTQWVGPGDQPDPTARSEQGHDQEESAKLAMFQLPVPDLERAAVARAQEAAVAGAAEGPHP